MPDPISFDAVTTSATGAAPETFRAFNHAISSSKGSRILDITVGIRRTDSQTVNTVTFDGVAATLIAAKTDAGNSVRLEKWRLVNPNVGTHQVLVTITGVATQIACIAESFFAVNQADPVGTAASAAGSSNTPAVNVAVAAGQWGVDGVAFRKTVTLTPDAGQTKIAQVSSTNVNDAQNVTAATSYQEGAIADMSWTSSGSDPWAIVAVPLKNLVGVTPVPANILG